MTTPTRIQKLVCRLIIVTMGSSKNDLASLSCAKDSLRRTAVGRNRVMQAHNWPQKLDPTFRTLGERNLIEGCWVTTTPASEKAGGDMSDGYSSAVLDHLGLVAGMYDELGIGAVLDRVIVQDQEQRRVSVGQAVKAMVLNGLGFVNQRL